MSRARRAAFFALLAVTLTCAFPYLGALHNPNENVRVYATMALVELHTPHIEGIIARHGDVADTMRTADGHVASVKGPLTSILGVPAYVMYRHLAPALGVPLPGGGAEEPARARWLRGAVFAARLLAVQLPCLAFLLGYARFLRAYSDDETLCLLTVAAVGLGTNYLAYALSFTSHALGAAAAFGAFALLARRERPLLAGLLAGAVTLLEYHALPLSASLAVHAAVVHRGSRASLARFAAGAAACAALLVVAQGVAFGTPFEPGHRRSDEPGYPELFQHGYFGMGVPSLYALRHLVGNASFGLFPASPFLLVAPVGLPFVAALAPARRALSAAWALHVAVLVITVSAAINWRGGWTIGPRYLCAAAPFLGFGALLALDAVARAGHVPRAVARFVGAGLALASVAQIGVVGVTVPSVPPEVARPLRDLAAPLLARGLTPWNAGDLIGAGGVVGVGVVASLLTAPLLAAVPLGAVARDDAPLGPSLGPARRWGAVALHFALALALAAAVLAITNGGARAGTWADSFAAMWEPRR